PPPPAAPSRTVPRVASWPAAPSRYRRRRRRASGRLGGRGAMPRPYRHPPAADRSCSPAGDAHVPRHRYPASAAVDDEVVALRLARDRLADRLVERGVGLAVSHDLPQVGGILLPEAHVERAGAGHANAIARLAEIVRERRDEAEPAAGLPLVEVAGRAAGAVGGFLERPGLCQPRTHQRERQILVEPVVADVAHRHDLDEGEVEALL